MGQAVDVVRLRKRVGRWRGFTVAFAAIAALLAAYIAVSKVAPDLLPPQLRGAGANLMARTEPRERGPSDRLVAILQQTPIAPAFLLTVDTQQRTVVVRRIAAGQENGRSYELWLITGRSAPPNRSVSSAAMNSPSARCRRRVWISKRCGLRLMRCRSSLPVARRPARQTGPVLFTGKAVGLTAVIADAEDIDHNRHGRSNVMAGLSRPSCSIGSQR